VGSHHGYVNIMTAELARQEVRRLLANSAARASLVSRYGHTRLKRREAESCGTARRCRRRSKYIERVPSERSLTGGARGRLENHISFPAGPQDDTFDYGFHGRSADAVVVDDYDSALANIPPGAIASADWFIDNLHELAEASLRKN